ncbi:DUF3427 domain-containing protein [Tahibacter soli]|uniref:DUF3427 domain-containing protein n=1 Tax=Tahibacter soli TaxID=2983605 RepID=A0A9X4BHE9_9GAMM|nr:DUF3427 domain-containing protein [Tahibacter soli]MDC8010992.1 DUF3427 domain-containing protein [Tahibacter soli]
MDAPATPVEHSPEPSGAAEPFASRFAVGGSYSKKDIYALCNVPRERQGGPWHTGYAEFQGVWFLFCNVGDVARTGHDYGDRFEGDVLQWYGKTGSRPNHPSIRALLDPATPVLIFYRANNRDPFTYRGRARAVSSDGSDPVRVVWAFDDSAVPSLETLAQEVVDDATSYVEGAVKQITVNAYERNPQARRACIACYGATCTVCGFRFDTVYGDIGAGFIEVHHLKPLSLAGGEYVLDPIEDLRPVCSNCHSMLHRHRPPLSIEDLIDRLQRAKK